MAESSVKQRKEEDTDRISSLPDFILCHIMSFLPNPTITSVTTMSLVSRRWRHLWQELPVFHFEDDEFYSKHFNNVPLFVNTVLTLRRFRNIQKFHLILSYEYKFPDWEKMFELWIRAATGPNLEELYLTAPSEYVELPSSIFVNCNNLVSLTLMFVEIKMNVQHFSVHFPSLKKLYVHSFNGADLIVSFLSACPVLETLESDYFCYNDISLTEVPVPPSFSSNRLKSTNHNFTWTYFELGNIKLGIVGNFRSMVEAFLDVFSPGEGEFVDPILKRIRDYKEETCLLSRHSTSKLPLHAPVPNYPEFSNLLHLKFILPCFNSNLVVNVLEKCHMLQVLIILSSKEEPPPLRTWQPESTVSECLKSHLTYIHVQGYQGLEDELIFVEYILRNGLVLQTMLIFVDISMDITNKYRSIKRLTNISKGSVACQLKFDADGSP